MNLMCQINEFITLMSVKHYECSPHLILYMYTHVVQPYVCVWYALLYYTIIAGIAY